MLGVVAIAGMPPFGVFMSEFLVVSSTFARQPLLALPLVAGLLVGFGALCCACTASRSASRAAAARPVEGVLCADVRPLALVLLAGVYLPPPLVAWFQNVAARLG